MSGGGTRGRRLLVTLTLVLAGAGVRHLIERHARRVAISERRPVAALLPPPDGPDAEVLPIASSDKPEPAFSASAATSLSPDSNQPATAPSASGSSVQPLSATADAESVSSPLPAQPVAGGGDAQSTRQFPAELQEQAANNAAGWVYEIDPGATAVVLSHPSTSSGRGGSTIRVRRPANSSPTLCISRLSRRSGGGGDESRIEQAVRAAEPQPAEAQLQRSDYGMVDGITPTPFGFDSTAAEVIDGIDLSGKRAIVTGGSSGIGVNTSTSGVAADGLDPANANRLWKLSLELLGAEQ